MANLCKSRKTVNSKVNPKNWYYGLEHCRTISYDAVPSGESIIPLNLIDEKYSEVLGYIHVTNGGTDPAPSGRTKIAEVDVQGLTLVSEVYTAIKAAMDAATLTALVQTQVITEGAEIFNNFIGLISEEDATGIADLNITVGQQSFGEALGLLSEDGASSSFEFETLDQTADATGNAIVNSFLINVLATVTMSLTDTSKDKFEELFVKPLGGTYENNADKLIGFGSGSFFKSLIERAGKLIGHDAGVDFSDRSNDWQMLASIKPGSINFNKELQIIEVEFVSYLDSTMPDAINIFSIGDKSKIDFAAL